MSEKDYINEEKLSKPSTVTPTLFVGLGGCGSDIAMNVAKLLRRDPDFEEKYRDLIKFAIVDTNINDLEKHRELADATFLISDFEKAEYSKLASGQLFLEPDEFFTQWIPADYRFRSGDTAGAGQIRIESRLGCYYQMKHGDFNAKFARLFDSMRAHNLGHRRIDTREIRIVICYSVAGGTGSGAHLVMSYMLKDLAKMVGKPVTVGVAVLPTVFEDKAGVNKDGIFANGYAALKETEHLMKLGSPESKFYPEEGVEFHYNPGDPSKKRVYDKPFDFLYVIDKPERFTVSDIRSATAAGLYLQFFSSIFKEQAGDYDNYTQHQRFLVPHDFEPKGIPGFTSFYGSFGSTVLHVPAESLVKYCSQAAAIGILRSNYFSSIPAGPVYETLSTGGEYYQVYRGTDINNNIKFEDFPKKKVERREMMNRLFRKRIHLLAQCEYNANKANFPSGKFSSIFKHGNPMGVVPENRFGQNQPVDARIQDAMVSDYDKSQANYSLYQFVVASLGSGKEGPLLVEAADVAKKVLEDKRPKPTAENFNPQLMEVELKKAQTKALEQAIEFLGTAEDSELSGFNLLCNLDKFFKLQAPESSLNERRYALLQLIETLTADEKIEAAQNKTTDAPEKKGGWFGPKTPDVDEQETMISERVSDAMREIQTHLHNAFVDNIKKYRTAVIAYLDLAADREEGIGKFLAEKEAECNRWMVDGDDQTEKYVLDGEAFQMENGLRLWDFYYLDKIKAMDELDSSAEAVQNIISSSFQNTDVTGSVANRNLFKALLNHAKYYVERTIIGNIESKDPDEKYGLTINEALDLEVTYRALYLSKRADIEKDPSRKLNIIESAITGYNVNPANAINLEDDMHKDYLVDKIKRLLLEKAGYLCHYDESREGQGGVRADLVKLIAINEDIARSGRLKGIINRAGTGFKMVTEAWNSRREIVFYQSVLNVPLYVFGRLDRMRHYYYEFKNMAKRSKVLHIDKNWENSLLDLDPQEAQKQHRLGLVRSNIIQFAALFSLHRLDGSKPYLLRHDGAYYLRNPGYTGTEVDLTSDDWDFLGHTMSESIEALPEILNNRAIRYVEYQQILSAALKGMTPHILSEIMGFPFEWRKSYDDLRAQYGDQPNPDQLELLTDFKNSYEMLSGALAELLVKIRNQLKEEETLGASETSLSALLSNAQSNTRASIRLLEGFERKWDSLMNPKVGEGLVNTRQSLFKPMEQDVINKLLAQLGKNRPTTENAKK